MSGEPEAFEHAVSEQVRAIALSLPETSEGSSCVNRAFKADGKNFAFLGETDEGCGLRLKLGESIPEVTDRFEVGTHGWTMLRFAPDDQPELAELERWVTESYRLLAPKRLVSTLDDAD